MQYPKRPREGVRDPDAGVAGGCGLPEVGTGNGTSVLCQQLQPLNHGLHLDSPGVIGVFRGAKIDFYLNWQRDAVGVAQWYSTCLACPRYWAWSLARRRKGERAGRRGGRERRHGKRNEISVESTGVQPVPVACPPKEQSLFVSGTGLQPLTCFIKGRVRHFESTKLLSSAARM